MLFCVWQNILLVNQLIHFSGSKHSFWNTTCIPESEMTLKVLFMLWAYTQSFPSRVLSPPWPGITTNDQVAGCVTVSVCVCVFETTSIMNCWSFHSWCFHLSPLVTDKCFPTVPTYRRLQASHIQTLTRSLTLRHTWQCQILLDASIKRTSHCFLFLLCPQWPCFSWTVAYCPPQSAMAVRSQWQKLHLLYRARKSSKCLHKASNDVPITALGDRANGLHLLHACHVWVQLCDLQCRVSWKGWAGS